jgi:hypothetical protein
LNDRFSPTGFNFYPRRALPLLYLLWRMTAASTGFGWGIFLAKGNKILYGVLFHQIFFVAHSLSGCAFIVTMSTTETVLFLPPMNAYDWLVHERLILAAQGFKRPAAFFVVSLLDKSKRGSACFSYF